MTMRSKVVSNLSCLGAKSGKKEAEFTYTAYFKSIHSKTFQDEDINPSPDQNFVITAKL